MSFSTYYLTLSGGKLAYMFDKNQFFTSFDFLYPTGIYLNILIAAKVFMTCRKPLRRTNPAWHCVLPFRHKISWPPFPSLLMFSQIQTVSACWVLRLSFTVEKMPHEISLTVFLAIILSANSQTNVEPHNLTGSEEEKRPKSSPQESSFSKWEHRLPF